MIFIFTGANLSNANLSHCCLERADLSGANLEGAQLQCIKALCANMEGAILRGCNFEDPSQVWFINLYDSKNLDSKTKFFYTFRVEVT